MSRPRFLLPTLVLIIAAACSETTGPFEPVNQQPTAQFGRQLVRFANAMVPEQFATVELTDDGEIPLSSVVKPQALFDGDGLTLSDYEVSFWAVKGEKREIRIDYLDEDRRGPKWRHYFKLKVNHTSLLAFPDGTPIRNGDSVLITAVVDPVRMAVSLEPSGLQFNEEDPVELEWEYKGAAEDINGDGVVNKTDKDIFKRLAMVWQHDKDHPWFDMGFKHDKRKKRIKALLKHFSNYAVAW